MNITMTRDEVKSLLDINNDRMKYLIRNERLNLELEIVGYKLINSYKNGRNTIYELEPIEIDEWLQYQSYRNIKKREEHTEYVENRITKGLSSSRRAFVRDLDIDISETTAKRYDDMLLDDEIITLLHTKTIKSVITDVHNVVYRMFDKNNNIIYIGKSNDLVKRMNGHSCEEKENDWFNKEVDRIEYITFNAYGDCSIAEMYFITKVKQKYNKDFITWETSINIDVFDNMIWNIAEIEEDEINVYGKGENYDRVVRLLKDRTKVNSK